MTPEMTPVPGLTDSIGGYPLADHMYGGVPPLPVKVYAQLLPMVPGGSERVVIPSEPITVNGAAADLLPPGLVTTIEATLGPASRFAGTVAVSEVPLTNVVANTVPPNEICEAAR